MNDGLTGTDIALIITAIGSVLSSILAGFATLIGARNGRIGTANSAEIKEVAKTVEQVHTATNSMKDQLVAATAKASQIEGHAQGVADQKAAVADAAATAPAADLGDVVVKTVLGPKEK